MAKTKEKPKKKPIEEATTVEDVLDAVAEVLEEDKINPRFAHLLGGRPRAIATVEELEARIYEYLNRLGRWGLPTKAGLSFSLGISRDTLNRYEKQEGFSDALKHWYALFEDLWAQRLSSPNATGTIFYLKNAHGYVDRHENDNTGRVIHYILPPTIAAKHGVPITQLPKEDYETKDANAENQGESPIRQLEESREARQSAPHENGEVADGSEGAGVSGDQLEEKDGEVSASQVG